MMKNAESFAAVYTHAHNTFANEPTLVAFSNPK